MTNLTLEEIGKLAGVSRATVSRVINEQKGVSENVRQKVREIIRETGFSPNLAARSLASQKTGMIGLVLPRSVQSFFGDPYFSRLTQGVASALNKSEYIFTVILIDSNEVEEKIIKRIMRRGFVDGVIIQAAPADDRILPTIINSSLPYIVAGRPMGQQNANYVDVDNINGAKLAVNHLIACGKTRIGTITGPLYGSPGLDRLSGYVEALETAGMKSDKNLIRYGDFTEEGGYQWGLSLLDEKPDAIFAASDVMAIGALRAAKEKGLRVPEDIAIVGFDDLPPSRFADPQLTTVRQPILRFGAMAVDLLFDCIKRGEDCVPKSTLLDVELVIRDSCGRKGNL